MDIEVLSAYDYSTKTSYGSQERYEEVLEKYPEEIRNHVANYAAHGWDILLVDGRLLSALYANMWPDGLHGPYAYAYETGEPVRVDKDPVIDKLYKRYEDKVRLFSLEK